MKRSGLLVLATISACAIAARAADATTPVDYTQRNGTFETNSRIAPAKKAPATNPTVQEKRVEKATVEKTPAPVGDRRAGIEVKESRSKQLREKDSQRPEPVEQPTNPFNHRPAAISTADDTTKPPLVTKYQDSLTAASATNMARFPAVDRATSAKINRFVFRKNPSEPPAATGGNSVTPAAGGSAVQK